MFDSRKFRARFRLPGTLGPGFLGLSLWFAWSCPAHAQFPAPELLTLSPPCIQAGETSVLQLSGNHLDESSELIFSRDGISGQAILAAPRVLEQSGLPTGQFQVKVMPEVPPGLIDVRCIGRFGASNPRRLLVTSKPLAQAEPTASEPGLAQDLEGDRIYWGQFAPAQKRYFRFSLAAGQSFAAIVCSRTLDSRAIPRLALINQQGHEVARDRAVEDWPARVAYTSPNGGDFLLVVHDFLYGGGPEHAFVLEAAVASDPNSTKLELDQLSPPPLKAAALPSGGTVIDSLVAPFRIQGTFNNPLESVAFRASKGQQWWIEVESASAHRLTDPRAVLYRLEQAADGSEQRQRLVEQDDQPYLGGPEVRLQLLDPAFAWTVPEDASYRLELTDNQSGARPLLARQFVLRISEPQPGFRVMAYPATPNVNRAAARPGACNLMRGGTVAIQLLVERQQGYTGTVLVEALDLPPGIAASETLITPGATEGTLILTAAESAAAWCGPLRLTARDASQQTSAKSQIQPVTVRFTPSPTRNTFDWRETAQLTLCVNQDDLAPLSVQLADEQSRVLEATQGSQLDIPIRIGRREGNQSAVLVRGRDLPPKSQLADVTIAADKSEGTAKLVLAADTPTGDYTLWLQAEVKLPWRRNPQALAREEAYLAELERAQQDPNTREADRPAVAAALEKQRAAVEQLKQQTAAREITVWLPSTSLRLKVQSKSP